MRRGDRQYPQADERRCAQRFTPRRPGSVDSQTTLEPKQFALSGRRSISYLRSSSGSTITAPVEHIKAPPGFEPGNRGFAVIQGGQPAVAWKPARRLVNSWRRRVPARPAHMPAPDAGAVAEQERSRLVIRAWIARV
jgi:hypothetical protein